MTKQYENVNKDPSSDVMKPICYTMLPISDVIIGFISVDVLKEIRGSEWKQGIQFALQPPVQKRNSKKAQVE